MDKISDNKFPIRHDCVTPFARRRVARTGDTFLKRPGQKFLDEIKND
jgi:hypothetical protein